MKSFGEFLKREKNRFFGAVFYHGSNREFYQFDPKYIGLTDTGTIGIGFYFTSDLDLAQLYAENAKRYRQSGSAVVMKYQVFPEKTLEIEGTSASVWLDKMKEIGIPDGTMKDNTEALLDAGYDSVCSYDAENNVREFVVLKPGIERYVETVNK